MQCQNCTINSLAPVKFEWKFKHVIFKQILVIDGWDISCEITIIWMLMDFTDDQSTLVQVMAWCRQATSHYLSQCWPRSLSPYGVTRPHWVKHLSELPWEYQLDSIILIWCRSHYLGNEYERRNHSGLSSKIPFPIYSHMSRGNSARERRRYICHAFSHWQRTFSRNLRCYSETCL